MKAHAWEYGFVMSYPKGTIGLVCYDFEPWHFRYVGRELAAQIVNSGLTPREYLWANFTTTVVPAVTPRATRPAGAGHAAAVRGRRQRWRQDPRRRCCRPPRRQRPGADHRADVAAEPTRPRRRPRGPRHPSPRRRRPRPQRRPPRCGCRQSSRAAIAIALSGVLGLRSMVLPPWAVRGRTVGLETLPEAVPSMRL